MTWDYETTYTSKYILRVHLNGLCYAHKYDTCERRGDKGRSKNGKKQGKNRFDTINRTISGFI